MQIIDTEGTVPPGEYRGYGFSQTVKTKEDVIAQAEKKHPEGTGYWLIHSKMLLVEVR